MNFQELTEKVAKMMSVEGSTAEGYMDSMKEAILESISKGESIQIDGVCNLTVTERQSPIKANNRFAGKMIKEVTCTPDSGIFQLLNPDLLKEE